MTNIKTNGFIGKQNQLYSFKIHRSQSPEAIRWPLSDVSDFSAELRVFPLLLMWVPTHCSLPELENGWVEEPLEDREGEEKQRTGRCSPGSSVHTHTHTHSHTLTRTHGGATAATRVSGWVESAPKLRGAARTKWEESRKDPRVSFSNLLHISSAALDPELENGGGASAASELSSRAAAPSCSPRSRFLNFKRNSLFIRSFRSYSSFIYCAKRENPVWLVRLGDRARRQLTCIRRRVR